MKVQSIMKGDWEEMEYIGDALIKYWNKGSEMKVKDGAKSDCKKSLFKLGPGLRLNYLKVL